MSTTCLGTLITYNPWTVTPASSLDEVAAGFAELGIHHVPVVDDQRRLVGILSETDLLRSRQQQPVVVAGGSAAGDDDAADGRPYLVRDLMSRGVRTISPTTTERQALKMLLDHHIHALPVVKDSRLVGMISSRDFVREFSYGESSEARDLISATLKPPVRTLEPDATLDDALLAMHETGASCLAVVMGICPVGVLSQRDVVRARRSHEEDCVGLTPAKSPTIMRIVRESPAIRPGQRLCDAAAVMVEKSLPAVTIVNQANRLMGLVTEDDILRVMYDGAE